MGRRPTGLGVGLASTLLIALALIRSETFGLSADPLAADTPWVPAPFRVAGGGSDRLDGPVAVAVRGGAVELERQWRRTLGG